MAALEPAHWETITPDMRRLLRHIGERPFADRFYLAGGTAVALRLGHRRSIDLDFFSETDDVQRPLRTEIVNAFTQWDPEVVEDVDGNLLMSLAELHVAFLSYGYPLLEEADTVEGVAMASLLDMGLIKMDALIGRGSRKDFYDLYFLVREIPWSRLFESADRKFPRMRDFRMMALEGMVQFENADPDVQPDLLEEVPWPTVKQFFIDEAVALGREWFGFGSDI